MPGSGDMGLRDAGYVLPVRVFGRRIDSRGGSLGHGAKSTFLPL